MKTASQSVAQEMSLVTMNNIATNKQSKKNIAFSSLSLADELQRALERRERT